MNPYIQASLGTIEAHLILKNCVYLDVFSGTWVNGEIAIYDGMIVGLEPGLKSEKSVDMAGKYIVPGFIDAHVHVESSLMTPGHFEQVALKRGTTTAICDPHELANVQGISGIEYFLDASLLTKLNLKIMLSSCVPATHLETNGGGELSAEVLKSFSSHPNVLGLAEMMNVPGVLYQDQGIMAKLESFKGMAIDGHAPLLRGKELSAYVVAGITTCHESTELEEAKEKVRKGMSVWIREGSVAKDLKELAPLLNEYTSACVGFCTDDRNPLDIELEGHVDHLVRKAILNGVKPEVAYRAASYAPARHYGLDRVSEKNKIRIGAVAPGYLADLVVLKNKNTCEIEDVYKSGVNYSEIKFDPKLTKELRFENSVRVQKPKPEDLEGPTGLVHAIVVIPEKIITGREIVQSDSKSVCRLTVLERHGKGLKPSNAYAVGFGEQFDGAIASSVGHDSHNLIAAGKSTRDLGVAFEHLKKMGGGFCVVQNETVIADLALPIGGLMSASGSDFISEKLKLLREASKAVHCELHEPFLQLAFLSLPVIPTLKLTDLGLVDVEAFKFIEVKA